MRRTLTVTVATAVVALGLAACAGASLTGADRARCQGVADLTTHTSATKWNRAFDQLATADDADLRDAGQSFASALLTHIDQGLPYQQRALSVCAAKGFKATAEGANPTGD